MKGKRKKKKEERKKKRKKRKFKNTASFTSSVIKTLLQ